MGTKSTSATTKPSTCHLRTTDGQQHDADATTRGPTAAILTTVSELPTDNTTADDAAATRAAEPNTNTKPDTPKYVELPDEHWPEYTTAR